MSKRNDSWMYAAVGAASTIMLALVFWLIPQVNAASCTEHYTTCNGACIYHHGLAACTAKVMLEDDIKVPACRFTTTNCETCDCCKYDENECRCVDPDGEEGCIDGSTTGGNEP